MNNIIDLNEYFKHKKQIENNANKNPNKKLYISNITGKITVNEKDKIKPKLVDVEKQKEERIKTIQESLKKINKIMAELKSLADEKREILNKPTIV